ncbi:MAG: thioredoxin-disulfide reductase [Solirubrobacterales bacterium]
MERRRVVIIGSGTAGYTAAIYAARAKLQPLCIEGYSAGGVLMTTDVVENYPGFADGISGPELMTDLRRQAERFGTEFLATDVRAVDFASWPFRLTTATQQIEAEAVIICTGAVPNRLGLPAEDVLDGFGVAYCAACDGAFFEGKRVAVIGGGDCAMDQAMSMAKIASEVVLVHRRNGFRATEIMVDYVRAHENISFLQPYTVEDILGVKENRVTGLRLRHAGDASERIEEVDGVFVSIGHHPASEVFTDFLDHDQHGYLKARRGSTMTNVDGVFVAGDVNDRAYRQAITAAGFGAAAAIDAERWLAHRGSWSTSPTGDHSPSNPMLTPLG